MKIYSAKYSYGTIYGSYGGATTYVGYDQQKAIDSLDDKVIMNINEDLIFDLKGEIEKHVEEWEDGEFVRFVLSSRR